MNRVDTVLFSGTSDLMRKGGECKYRLKEINADIFKRTSIRERMNKWNNTYKYMVLTNVLKCTSVFDG
jgi:hypothetical protein